MWWGVRVSQVIAIFEIERPMSNLLNDKDMRKYIPYLPYVCALAILLVAMSGKDEIASPSYAAKMGIAFVLIVLSVIILILARIERRK